MNTAEIRRLARSVEPFVLEVRRHIHARPELSFEESETAAFVAEHLREMGYEPQTGVGGLHAITARLAGGRPGPTIGLRADMDALPITELTDLPFQSRNPGVMHACGHDTHTAMLLGAARALRQAREQLAGNVVFLFQPAEELGPGGAQAMVQAGALAGVDAAFGLHIGPSQDAGQLGFMAGVSTANSDGLKITITGKGGHAAHPHLSVDAVAVAGYVIVGLQQIVSRQVAPTQSAVITIGAIHGGTKGNIIAEQVELVGTVRTLDAAIRESMPRRIETLVRGVCESFGAAGAVQYRFGYPSVVNDAAMVALARKAAAVAVGEEKVFTSEVSMGGEDFAYMLQAVPGCMGRLGSSNPATPVAQRYPLHNARMLVDEAALVNGVAFYIALAVEAGGLESPLKAAPRMGPPDSTRTLL